MDTQTTPFRHRTTTWYLAWPGTLWPQDFIRGRLASLFEAKGNRVKTLSFFPGLDLRAVVDLSRPYDCPDLSVFDLDAQGGDYGPRLVLVASLRPSRSP